MRSLNLQRAVIIAGLVALPGIAAAGPCSDDIATIGRQLSQSPALGPATTGTLTGSNPGSTPSASQPSSTGNKGTSADQRVGGTAGTKEMNAASGSVATSDADVRQQQLGHPIASTSGQDRNGVETAPGKQQVASSASDDRMSRAKSAWQKAVDLNAKDDSSCKSAIAQARSALQGS